MVQIRSPKKKVRGQGGGATRRSSLELVLIPLLCLAFMFGVVRPFVAEPFGIPSESMTPTLKMGDSVLVNKLAYRFTEPHWGDLVVFEGSGDAEGSTVINAKRVVGLPGDTVEVWDGDLYVNGEAQKEPYVDHRLTVSSFFGPETVPEGEVFVMGDNRSNSRDSRTFGPVSEEELIGKVTLRFWPLSRIGTP